MNDLKFQSFSTVFQSYPDNGRVILESGLQWNSGYDRKTSTSSRILRLQTRPEVIKPFFHAQSCYIVGILTFMSMKNSIYAYLSLKKAEFLDVFILLSIINFMLS